MTAIQIVPDDLFRYLMDSATGAQFEAFAKHEPAISASARGPTRRDRGRYVEDGDMVYAITNQ